MTGNGVQGTRTLANTLQQTTATQTLSIYGKRGTNTLVQLACGSYFGVHANFYISNATITMKGVDNVFCDHRAVSQRLLSLLYDDSVIDRPVVSCLAYHVSDRGKKLRQHYNRERDRRSPATRAGFEPDKLHTWKGYIRHP